MPKRKTNEEFLCEINTVNPNVKVIGTYAGFSKKVECECRVCKHRWPALPGHLLHGHGCPKCGNKANAQKRTWSEDRYKEELKRRHPNIALRGKYVKAKLPTEFECLVCHHVWPAKPYYLLSGRGCPKCGKKQASINRRLQKSEVFDRLKTINPNILIIGEYKTTKDHAATQCLICGHIWAPSVGNLLSGYGCPNCNHGSTSYPEQFIYNVFTSILGPDSVLSRDKKTVGKELDIYLPSLKIAIEYGSWHWHHNRLDKDREKIDLCKSKGIDLITIIDNCPNEYNDNSFWCYTEKIERDDELMRSLIHRLLKTCELDAYESAINFDKVNIAARSASRKKSTDDFKRVIEGINPKILITGDYESEKVPIESECLVCGYKWMPLPGNLLRGSGCPNCSGRRRLSQKEFTTRLRNVHPNLTTSDQYINSTTELTFQCKTCSSVFKRKPNYLWRGAGCPACKESKHKEESSNKRIERLREHRPSIEVLSPCYNANEEILCRCKECGFKWADTYNHLVDKHGGCPKCLRKTAYLRNHFADDMAKILPDVTILTPYSTINSPVLCQCKKCKYEWSASPYRLMQGHGCKYCSGTIRRVAQLHENKLVAVFESVAAAAKAVGASKQAIWRCCNGKTKKSHGYVWKYLD